MLIASNGHLFGHMPHPVHSFSSIIGFLSPTLAGTMQSLPSIFTGHTLAHRYPPHPSGLHLSFLIIAILGIKPPERFELSTYCLRGSRYTELSYGGVKVVSKFPLSCPAFSGILCILDAFFLLNLSHNYLLFSSKTSLLMFSCKCRISCEIPLKTSYLKLMCAIFLNSYFTYRRYG